MTCRRRPGCAAWKNEQGIEFRPLSAKGVRVGKNQPIRHCAQHMRQRIFGQQAGIDCNAAATAAIVPTASWQADMEPTGTIVKLAGQYNPGRKHPSESGHARLRLRVALVYSHPNSLIPYRLVFGNLRTYSLATWRKDRSMTHWLVRFAKLLYLRRPPISQQLF